MRLMQESPEICVEHEDLAWLSFQRQSVAYCCSGRFWEFRGPPARRAKPPRPHGVLQWLSSESFDAQTMPVGLSATDCPLGGHYVEIVNIRT